VSVMKPMVTMAKKTPQDRPGIKILSLSRISRYPVSVTRPFCDRPYSKCLCICALSV
jgi:hypothetical protein